MTEIATIEISTELLQMLVDSDVITSADFRVKLVDIKDYDYSTNPLWVAQKAKSDKEFKKLKQMEFNIRNGI